MSLKGGGGANIPRKCIIKMQNRVISKRKTTENEVLKKGFYINKSNDIRNYMAGGLVRKVGGFGSNLTLKKGRKNLKTCEDLNHQGTKYGEEEKFTLKIGK